jgi:flagellar hook-length control protein FliK
VRASATSRLAPPAGFHAARADSNAPKTDEASPFALLVGAAVAPAQKPSNTPDNASGGKGDDKPDDGKSDQANAAQTAQTQTTQTQTGQTQATQTQAAAPAGDSQPPSQPANDTDQDQDAQAATDPNAAPNLPQTDLNTAPLPPVTGDTQAVSDAGDDIASDGDNVSLWPQSARPQPPIGQAGKPVKADKTDKSDKKDVSDQPAQPDVATVVTTDLLPPELQVAAITPPPAPQTIVPPVADASDQTQIAAAPAIAPANTPVMTPAAQPGQPTDQIASQDAPQTADQDAPPAAETAPQAAGPVARSQPPAVGTPPAQQPQPKTESFAPATLAAAVNPQPGQNGSGQPQIDPSKDGPAITPAKAQPKPVALKADAVLKTTKSLPGKSQQVNDPAAVKGADAPADDTDDSVKPDTARSAAPATDAAAPKLAANIADTITIPPVGQPGLPQTQAADFTQHIQVTAQPHDTAPNLPALAVEIAAKSQSGAKQFDIRLDPPELGRVEVRLSIDATGKASAHLSADQPQTLSLLQKDASVLTRALRDAGLDVSQNGLNFSLRQQSGQDAGAGANPGRRSGRGLSLTATTSIEATAASAAYYGPADGHLDIMV